MNKFIFLATLVACGFSFQAFSAEAVKVSPGIVGKLQKLNSMRSVSGLPLADKGNTCWVYSGKTNGGEEKQACLIFVGEQRCVLSNYRGLRCGSAGRETECKIKKDGDLRCTSDVGLAKVEKRCYMNEYKEKVCGGASRGGGRMPASSGSRSILVQ